jgi:hypothetical protein
MVLYYKEFECLFPGFGLDEAQTVQSNQSSINRMVLVMVFLDGHGSFS